MASRYRLALSFAAGVLVVAACGGDEATQAPVTDAPPTAAASPTDAPMVPTEPPEPSPTAAPTVEPEPEAAVTAFGMGLFRSAVFTPDGERILVTAPGRLLFYPANDIEAEPEVVTLGGDIADVVYSPDGSLLAVGFASGDVQVLDASTLEVQTTLEGAVWEWAGVLAFSPDNSRLAVGHEIPSFDTAGDNAVYDLESGEAVITIPDYRPSDYLFSPDGSLLVGGDTRTVVTAWDAETGTETGSVTLNEDPFQGNVELLFDEQGSTLYASENKAGVFAIDPASMELTGPFADEIGANGNYDLALSPDGETLYVRSTNRVMLFDTATQAATDTIGVIERSGPAYGYDLSPDGSGLVALVTQWSGSPTQQLDLWDVATRERLQTNDTSHHAATLVDIAPGGDEVIASHADRTIQIWDVAAVEPALVDDHADTYLGYYTMEPDRIIAGVLSGPFWTATARSREAGTDTAIDDARFSPGMVVLADAAPIMDQRMAYDRVDDRVAVEDGGVLSVVAAADGETVFTIEDAGVSERLVFSADGSTLASVGDDVLNVYAADTGEVLQSLALEDLRPVFALGPDGQRFAVMAGRFSSDTRIYVYDVGEEEPVHVLDPDGYTWALAFDHAGDTLAFGRDEQLQSFDLAAEEFATPIDIGERLVSMAFGPDDQLIIGGTDRGTLVRVDLGD